MIAFMLTFAAFLVMLAVLAAAADYLDEERADARRRNR